VSETGYAAPEKNLAFGNAGQCHLPVGNADRQAVMIVTVFCSGSRQATRLRQRYLAAVLRQDAAYFDVHARSGELMQGLNEDTAAIQLGIGEKVWQSHTLSIHYTALTIQLMKRHAVVHLHVLVVTSSYFLCHRLEILLTRL
jgi:ABC-type multidrug transport system fused ATPase/permease subunit